MAIQISRLGDICTQLGECPQWDAASGRLWLMDCRAGQIIRLDPQTDRRDVFTVPAPAGSFALNADGRLIVALREEVVALDPATGQTRFLARIGDSHPNLRLNDGAAMPDGSFVVGTMHVFRAPDEPPLGGLYRLAPDHGFARIATGIGVTNGPNFNPADGRLYVCDSAARVIWSFAMAADGTLSDKTAFADTAALGSAPDGCCFDAEGGLWTALVHAGALVRLGAGGHVTHRIDLPVAHPASLCFGGDRGDQIFVTTISDSGRLRADGPLDGAVLRVTGAGFVGAPRWQTRIA